MLNVELNVLVSKCNFIDSN